MKMLVLVAGIFATKSESFTTNYYRIHGASCHSTTPGLTGEAFQYGIGNPSSTQALNVACPVTVPELNYTEGYLAFLGYDRHGTDAVSCTMNFTNNDGSISNSVSTATTGSDLSKVKYGNGVRVSPTGVQKILWLNCRIPPTYNGGWMSILTSLYIGLTY
jgi:hypothetical protein